MPRVAELRTNFTAGELSDNVDARSQFSRYFDGSIKLENYVVLPQGGIFRRKGFQFLGETKDSSKASRLIPFEFSSLQTYAFEVGEGYIRFFSQQGRVLDDEVAISGATKANPVVITTSSSHGYSNGDEVILSDIVGMTELNGNKYKVANVTATTFELQGIDGTSYAAYVSGGTSSRIHEITNPYSESEVFDIKFIQTNDVIYLIHPNHPLQKIIRLEVNEFSIEEVQLLNGPFTTQNTVSINDLTLTGGAYTAGSSLTMTASGGHTPFQSGHVGSLWRLVSGSDIAYVKVTAFTSSTVVTVEAINAIPALLQATAVFTWSEGEFSDVRGFPTAATFHEQRLILAGNIANPQRLYFSKTNADYENFTEGTAADDAFSITIAATKGDPIRWLLSDDILFIGTASGIWKAENSNNESVLSAVNLPNVKKQISFGCSLVQPELVGESPIYFQKGNKKARSISYSVTNGKYNARDITIDADHITGTGIKQIDFQQNPISNLFAVRNDGQMAILTAEINQEVLGWSRFTTQGSFESVAIISSTEDEDEIYTIVNRTINGVTKRFVELQQPNFDNSDLQARYVDCSLTYNGTKNTTLTLSSSTGSFLEVTEADQDAFVTEDNLAEITESQGVTFTSDSAIFSSSDVGKEIHELSPNKGMAKIISYVSSTVVEVKVLNSFSDSTIEAGTWAIAIKNISGLSHLAGESVQIMSDGATEPNKTVSTSGTIEINNFGSIIHVGLKYESRQKNMPLEATALQSIIGSSQGKDKRIDSAIIKFKETRGASFTDVSGKVTDIPFRGASDNMNVAPSLFSGFREVTVSSTWDKEGFLEIIQSDPQPMYIKSITYRVTVNNK